jgi:hypothetical protein
LRGVFQDSLNCAITHGQRPARWIGLGDETRAAIDVVAHEHPEATVDQIACAYDAFAREHGSSDLADPMESEPHRLEARRDRFRRA